MMKEIKFTGLELEKLQTLIKDFQRLENDIFVWVFDDLSSFYEIAQDIIIIIKDKIIQEAHNE